MITIVSITTDIILVGLLISYLVTINRLKTKIIAQSIEIELLKRYINTNAESILACMEALKDIPQHQASTKDPDNK